MVEVPEPPCEGRETRWDDDGGHAAGLAARAWRPSHLDQHGASAGVVHQLAVDEGGGDGHGAQGG
ncbi:hypothetical protein GCM10028771_13160 [Nocardioides marmoraquaticus]